MANTHPLAGLIWAAILVIAIQLLPNVALAHAGHHHNHALVQQQSAAESSEADQATAAQVQEPEFVAASSSRSVDEASGCVGGCCGAGLGCGCMTSALAGAVQGLPPLDTHPEPISFAVRPLGGIQPDALSRPPKFPA